MNGEITTEIGGKKLGSFENAVNAEVDKEIDDILSAANAEKETTLAKINDDSLSEAYGRIQNNIKKIESKYVKLIAKEELDVKRAVLVHKNELLEKLFDDVKNDLKKFAASDAYKSFLAEKLKDEKLENAKVCLREEDFAFCDFLDKSAGRKLDYVKDDSIKIGGLSVLYPNESIISDKTLDTAAEDAKADFIARNLI